jgi:hypothetical protein
MTCNECQSLVSAQLDGDISPAELVAAEQHLALCSRCAVVFDDLKTLVAESGKLPLFEPEARLWMRVQTQCEAERLIRTQKSFASWFEWARVPEWPRMATAAGTLVVLILVATVWLYRGLGIEPTTPVSETAQEMQATQEIRLAEQHYLQAIDSLENITRSRMAQMDPSLKDVLEDNLATIDYYIDKCRETVKNEPSNALAQRYLLEAYRKKVDLLTSVIHSDVL